MQTLIIQILNKLYNVSRYLTNLNKREIALHFRRRINWQKCWEKFRRPTNYLVKVVLKSDIKFNIIIQIMNELYFVSRYLTNLNKREIALHFRRRIIWQKCREKFRRPSKLFGQSGAQIPQEDSYARSTTIIAQQF